MNKQLEEYARGALRINLLECTEEEQHRFKQMYADGNLDLSMDQVVINMDISKLDWAMQQVQRTLNKRGQKT